MLNTPLRVVILCMAISPGACAKSPLSNVTPLDDGDWRVELSTQATNRLVSLEPEALKWYVYMDARGDLRGFELGQIKDALTVRSSGIECANWRHIHRTSRAGIPGVTLSETHVDCEPPLNRGTFSNAPLAEQIRSATELGFSCAAPSPNGVICNHSIFGRAVESTLGYLAHPRPPSVAVEFRVDYELRLTDSHLPEVTCRTWQRSSPPNAFSITVYNDQVGVVASDTPNAWSIGPIRDCALAGSL
jgi:hypothetical protein